jgi:hypothetical protein
MLRNEVKQGEHAEQEAPGAEDIEQDVTLDALRTNVPAEFIDCGSRGRRSGGFSVSTHKR